jgi:hypothetical protein
MHVATGVFTGQDAQHQGNRTVIARTHEFSGDATPLLIVGLNSQQRRKKFDHFTIIAAERQCFGRMHCRPEFVAAHSRPEYLQTLFLNVGRKLNDFRRIICESNRRSHIGNSDQYHNIVQYGGYTEQLHDGSDQKI